MAIFAHGQYCIYVDIVGGLEKVHKYADVMYRYGPLAQNTQIAK